jgi:hypothetical protein
MRSTRISLARTAVTRTSFSRWLTRALLLVLAAAAVGAPAEATARTSATTAQGNAVLDWNLIAQNATAVGRPPGGAAVLQGIVQAAIYDAVVAIEGGYEPFIASPTVPRPASTAAAVAAAAHDVLVVRVPLQATYVEAQYTAYLATIPDGPAKTNGITVGEEVARAILAWRANDHFDEVVPYEQPPPGPGVFEPVLPTEPVDVKLTRVTPLTFGSNDQFRPDGPNPLTSAEYAEDFNEVKAYGRVDSSIRTPAQTDIARFWSDNAVVQWPRALRALALEKGLGLAETARMLTLMQVAGADAVLACFDAKYHYLFWRPIHAIRRADTDGNPATEPDPTWTPLLFVNHPEYPGAHGCLTTAITETMAAFFGTDKVTFSVESTVPTVQQKTRYYERFSDAAKEVYDARTWAGLHFRNSTMEGAWIGKKVARHVVANFFRPLDPDSAGSTTGSRTTATPTSRPE